MNKRKQCIVLSLLALAMLTGCKNNTDPPNNTTPPNLTESIDRTDTANHHHTYSLQYQVNATCKSEGKRVEQCSCGDIKTTVLEKTDHDYTEKITQKATCEGNGVKTLVCSGCNQKTEEQIPALGHQWKTIKKTNATCSSEGVESQYCDRCKKENEKVVEKTDHKYTVETIPSTCLKEGYKQNKCSICGATELIDMLPKGEHDYELFEKVPSSCSNEGILEKKCKVCKHTETSVLPIVEHKFIEETKEATCEEDGYYKKLCEYCGLILEEIVYTHIGHDYKTLSIVPSTCTQAGTVEKKCVNCGDVQEDKTPILKHSFSTYEIAATCTNTGSITEKCGVCGFVNYTESTPSLKHDYIVESENAATCTHAGEVHKVCQRCQDSITEHPPQIPHAYELKEDTDEYQYYECAVCKSSKTERKN